MKIEEGFLEARKLQRAWAPHVKVNSAQALERPADSTAQGARGGTGLKIGALSEVRVQTT